MGEESAGTGREQKKQACERVLEHEAKIRDSPLPSRTHSSSPGQNESQFMAERMVDNCRGRRAHLLSYYSPTKKS